MLAGRLPRVGAWIGRLRELWPLTGRGVGVSASAAFALWFYGFGALDGVWFVAGLGLIALALLAVLVVVAASLRMRRALRRASRDEAAFSGETERETHSALRLPRLRFWPFVSVRVRWTTPPSVQVRLIEEGAEVREALTFGDHGEFASVLRGVELRDVFGLSSITQRLEQRAKIDILPHAGALRALPLLWSLSGGDDIPHPMGLTQGDRLELKRYAPGDPARFIHWKVYARTRKLMVRMPERALSRAHRVAAYLVAGDGDGPSAACARVALEEGALGAEFRFGADGSPSPEGELAPALVALRRSSAARENGQGHLSAFIEQVEREGPCALVLFVPPRLGAAHERVRGALARRRGPVRVVIGVDGIERGAANGWLKRLLLLAPQTERTAELALKDTVAAYQRLGAAVVVVDRRGGRLLSEGHLAPHLLGATGAAA